MNYQVGIAIDPSDVPSGMDYCLATWSLLGDRACSNVEVMENGGWRKVPRSRHPNLKSEHDVWIIYGGQILLERPKYLTERTRQFEQAKADAQLIAAVGGLRDAAAHAGAVFGERRTEARIHDPDNGSSVFVSRTNARPLNPDAPAIVARGRRRNLREIAILNGWRFWCWLRDGLAGRWGR